MVSMEVPFLIRPVYSRSPKVGNPIASILKSSVQGVPALFGLNPVSNFVGVTVWLGHVRTLLLDAGNRQEELA